ncbi:MAG TPA: excisionase family DNA-binding protein [Pseudonocardia sp.]|jgi:excisionase family DNA binding protein|nr:excisionase family DNA-binding protein [Pseudonocardia sp.]
MGDIHRGASTARPGPGGVQNDLLTVYEAAAALGIPKIAVYRLVECGELAWIRHGESVRIRRGSIDLLLREAM